MGLIDLFFPKKCLGCGREGRYVCPDCIGKVKKVKPICPFCERPSIDGTTHFACRRKFGIDGLTSVWEYKGAIRKAILALKYKYATEITNLLNGYIVEELRRQGIDKLVPSPYCLVPIPLHWYRQNFRGFNQAEEIGKAVAKEMSWEFIPDLLIKRKLTTPQTELKAEDRSKNIKGVFALNSNRLLPSAQCLILFDDVWTTGSTMKEAAKVLKRAGAKSVWGLTIAR